ncbi:MAG: fumarylacetoacetate hydrolase family protein [Alphaproteobacteria bacterium]|jgi:2-keto-4-pentenoate hydratase/2-oxohepta-3-ene-1,7-dioic acid hydratase in catechol pathway|nr:fumarylacetoacetate hydrolase family protein [Alphaproteobacteria bacterium]
MSYTDTKNNPPRFASYRAAGEDFWGLATEAGMIALSPDFPHWPDLGAVIAADGLAEAATAAAGRAVTHSEFDWQIPLPRPEKIICVGVNFPDRNAEYKDGSEAPANMSLFIRFARSFVGHDQPLIRPKASEQLDYEGEIALVIGRAGRHIAEADAYQHIAALTLCNEGTLRDWVRHAKFNVTQGKNFDKSGAMGPWLVPFTRPEQLDDVQLTTRVNGELRQDDRTSRMLFPVRRQIAYISTFTTLMPGDIIVTGTPTGAGARLDPPRWLVPGDEVVIEAEGIGKLVNIVEDEQ